MNPSTFFSKTKMEFIERIITFLEKLGKIMYNSFDDSIHLHDILSCLILMTFARFYNNDLLTVKIYTIQDVRF